MSFTYSSQLLFFLLSWVNSGNDCYQHHSWKWFLSVSPMANLHPLHKKIISWVEHKSLIYTFLLSAHENHFPLKQQLLFGLFFLVSAHCSDLFTLEVSRAESWDPLFYIHAIVISTSFKAFKYNLYLDDPQTYTSCEELYPELSLACLIASYSFISECWPKMTKTPL